MIGIIYKYTNVINGKSYIGQTTDPIQRHNEHLIDAKKGKTHFHKALSKYGIENFEYTIIDTVNADNIFDLKKELNEKEIYYIEYYDTYKSGYNSTKGGDGVIIDGSNWRHINHDKHKTFAVSDGKHPNSHIKNNVKEKEKMAYAKIKNRVLCIETNELFDSTRDVERKKGYKHQNIDAACRTGGKSYKYHWKFIPFEKKDPSEFIDIEKTLKENLEILFNMGIKIGRAKIGKLLSAKRKEKREKMLKDLVE